MLRTKTSHGPKRLRIETLERASTALRSLAHPQRLRLVEELECCGELTVSCLIEKTGFSQATISQHLTRLRRNGLLTARREGRKMFYSITDSRVLSILDCICNHASEGDFE